jgi:ABC-type multidrug transport system fused ATPase/permease subunit
MRRRKSKQKTWAGLRRSARLQRGKWYGVVVMSTGQAVCVGYYPAAMQTVFEGRFGLAAVQIAGALGGHFVFESVNSQLSIRAAEKMHVHQRDEMTGPLKALPAREVTVRDKELMQSLGRDLQTQTDIVANTPRLLMVSVAEAALGSTIALLVTGGDLLQAWQLPAASVGITAAGAATSSLLTERMNTVSTQLRDAVDRVDTALRNLVRSERTYLQIIGAEDPVQEYIRADNARLLARYKQMMAGLWNAKMVDGFSIAAALSPLALNGWLDLGLSASTLGAACVFNGSIAVTLQRLHVQVRQLPVLRVATEGINDKQDRLNELVAQKTAERRTEVEGTPALVKDRGVEFDPRDIETIEFDGVKMPIGIDQTGRPNDFVLEGTLRVVDLAERAIHLLGLSGLGKSRTAKVLTGEERPHSGRILVNGLDLHTRVNMESYQRLFGIAPQEDHLLDRTVGEALALSRTNPTPDQMVGALFALRLRRRGEEPIKRPTPDTPLSQTPYGEALLRENIAELSGGERARVLFARSLFDRPRMLVIDEVTSSQDPAAADAVLRLARESGAMVVNIAHSIGSVRGQDEIVLLKMIGGGETAGVDGYRYPYGPMPFISANLKSDLPLTRISEVIGTAGAITKHPGLGNLVEMLDDQGLRVYSAPVLNHLPESEARRAVQPAFDHPGSQGRQLFTWNEALDRLLASPFKGQHEVVTALEEVRRRLNHGEFSDRARLLVGPSTERLPPALDALTGRRSSFGLGD